MSKGNIMECSYKGIKAYRLENEQLKLTFLPQYGCKLASLISKRTGREFLFQSSKKKLVLPSYGAVFSAFDSSGFDEVFPSIDVCPYPQGPFAGTPVPDHGEIWALPWETVFSSREKSIKASVKSPKFPYIFSRKAMLKQNKIIYEYCVENTAKVPFECMWTPHCLLACSTATRLLIPPELDQVMTVEHSTRHLGPWGTLHTYPSTVDVRGKVIDLSCTEPISAKNCEKFYFTSPNLAGWCGIEHTDTHERLIYTYSARQVPYLGVWKTQGGYRGDYNLALEPCTGVYDDLYVAHKIRRADVISPQSKKKWKFTMTVY